MNTRLAAVLLLLACAVLTSGCDLRPNSHTLPGQVAVGRDGYTVTATFDNVENLVPNSAVMADDVTIGTVTRIAVSDWKAKVTMRLKRSTRLPANVRLLIGQKTLLGAQYVEIQQPVQPAGHLVDGAKLTEADTGVYPETEQILAGVSLLLNNGGLSQLSTITGELSRALDGRIPDTRQLIRQLNQVLAVADRRKQEFIAALTKIDSLAAKLRKEREMVADALDAVAPGLKALETERKQLVHAIDAVGHLSKVGNEVITRSRDSLEANLESMRPILNELAKAGDSIPEALKYLITVPFPVGTSENAFRGDYVNLFATIDVSVPSLTAAFLGDLPGTGVSSGSGASGVTADDILGNLPGAADGGAGEGLVQKSPSNQDTGQPGDDDSSSPSSAPDCGTLRDLIGGC
ncbi:MCE family protein [Nocardioides sp. NPDC006273]|uniref:MCE family protein n=1 Tax=Nocardioides sp. NPDC006273 TaxID=3155598 RepID=UPI0033A07C05